MKATNYDVVANAFFNGVGYLKELGSYAGEYMTEAYDALGIEEELEDDEWCDLCVTRDGEIYAVFGDTTADGFGEFAFKKIER